MSELNFAAATGTPDPAALVPDPFYPAVGMADMRAAVRIDATVTAERLYHATEEAVYHANRQLEPLKRRRTAQGVTEWNEAAAMRYRHAVYAYAKALLVEQYADYDASGKAQAHGETKLEQAAAYRRRAHAAIADLLGRQRTDAELI